jgi:uncharacterized protein
MKFRLSTAAFIFVLGLAAPVAAGSYEDGSAAYVSGHYETALRLWQPMADEGHSGAQFGLGLLYDMGRGVAKNNVIAHMWFDLSAAHGNPGAVRKRDLMAQRMTPVQIIEALKLARQWQEERNND